MTTQISSDELHLLIFRFLQESGFEHSAYVFASESMLGASSAATAEVPCGALISFLHKGLLFEQLEREVEEPKRARLLGNVPIPSTTTIENNNNDSTTASTAPSPIVLRGHQNEVFACSFSSKEGNLLASGSGDGCARIWKIDADGKIDFRLLEHKSSTKIISTENDKTEQQPAGAFDVTTLAWSPDGSLLATGSLDGRVRIWTSEGVNVCSLIHHNGPVFSVKWSSQGKRIVSGGQDKTAVVWDVATQTVLKSFLLHQLQTLDVDWRPFSGETPEEDDDVFASCSSDKKIVICRVSNSEQIVLAAHEDEVNAVKWSFDGAFLASCSDDSTAKIWSNFAKKSVPLDLRGHSREVYAVKWSPTGPGTHYSTKPRRIATASFDTTVKLWDPENGQIVHTLSKQSDAVYAIEFDPSGDQLVSGSFDGFVNVWSVELGTLLKSVKVGAGVFDVSWNIRGDKFAAASADGCITVVDF